MRCAIAPCEPTSRPRSPPGRSCAPGPCAARCTSCPPRTCAGCSVCSRRGVIAGRRARYRQLELDAPAFTRSRRILTRALEGGRRLTRRAAYAALESGGVAPTASAGSTSSATSPSRASSASARARGGQPTFVLLDEWIPRGAASRSRDEALAALAMRYFAGHGPATLQDFAWWTGLLVKDARRAIEIAGDRLSRRRAAGGAMLGRGRGAARREKATGRAADLLPSWDEYLVAYRDRAAALGPSARSRRAQARAPRPADRARDRRASARLLAARAHPGSRARDRVETWEPAEGELVEAIERAAARYAAFLGRTLAPVFGPESAA